MPSLKEKIKNATYGALESVTRNSGFNRVINEFNVRFPARHLRYYSADYEPKTFEFIKNNCHPGDVVLDIGAHIGLFGIVLAQIVGQQGSVYCFEPTPSTREVLTEVVKLNNCSDIVKIRGEAVSDEKGTATFYDTGDSDVSNANSLVKTERSHHGIEVQITTVDAFARENDLKINCLKIDVEGAEFNLLRGASETFLKDKPVVHLSLHPFAIEENKQTLSEIWNLLESYKMKVLCEDSPVTKDWFCSQKELFDVCLFPLNS